MKSQHSSGTVSSKKSLRKILLLLVFSLNLVVFLPVSNALATALVFALDNSGSMMSTDADSMGTTRFTAMINAVHIIVGAIPVGTEIGFVHYNSAVTIGQTLTSDKATFLAALDRVNSGPGATATGPALDEALNMINPAGLPKSIILITDGAPNVGTPDAVTHALTAAENAGSAGVPICSIGFGAAVGSPGPDSQFISDIATKSGGSALFAPDAAELNNVLDTCIAFLRRTSKEVVDVLAFPNPATGSSPRITFSALNVSSFKPIRYVSIFDFTGKPVTRIAAIKGSTAVSWTLRRDNGNLIASGKYFFTIEYDDASIGHGRFTFVK